MLNSIRNFSKTLLAKILLFIVVIPFVFWGMGGVFSSGNTNSLAKIDKINLSTQEFIKHINNLRVNEDSIRENLDNNIIEELLSEFISKKILEIQIDELNLSISEKNLVSLIKKNPNFLDDNNFSRIKYEKFLLSNNIDAPTFEKRLKDRELENSLFNFISGGIYSPSFLTKKLYEDETKKIEIKYISLNEAYGSKNDYTISEINEYIEKNREKLKKEYLNFSYTKLVPNQLTGSDEFDQNFFDKIDEIENKILTGTSLNQLASQYDLKIIKRENITNQDNLAKIDKEVLKLSKNNLLDVVDMNDFYLIYEIDEKVEKLPDIKNDKFINIVKEKIYNEKKYAYNLAILQKISSKNFTDADFDKIVDTDQTKIKKLLLNSPRDNKTFNIESINLIYTLPLKSFTLASDKENNIYLLKILKENINKSPLSTEKLEEYRRFNTTNINKQILSSYDYYLNQKYKIKINEQTLERVKNYFR